VKFKKGHSSWRQTGNRKCYKTFSVSLPQICRKEFCKMVKTLEKSLKALLYGLIKRTVWRFSKSFILKGIKSAIWHLRDTCWYLKGWNTKMVTAAEDRQVTGNVIKLFSSLLLKTNKPMKKRILWYENDSEKSLKASLLCLIEKTVQRFNSSSFGREKVNYLTPWGQMVIP